MSPSTVAMSEAEQGESLAALRAALREWHACEGGPGAEPPPWLPQMRCLVQAGVPKVGPLAAQKALDGTMTSACQFPEL